MKLIRYHDNSAHGINFEIEEEGRVMSNQITLPHRQKVVMQELQEQIVLLENGLRDEHNLGNIVNTGKAIGRLSVAIKIIEQHIWRQ